MADGTAPASAGGPAAAPTPLLPIRFHILFHAAIRAELDRLDEEVRRIEAQPVGAKDFRALGFRCRFLHDVYQYHSRLEDEVCVPISSCDAMMLRACSAQVMGITAASPVL